MPKKNSETPDDQRFGCVFSTSQIAAVAIVGAGGIKGDELDEFCRGKFSGAADLFNTLMHMKSLGLVDTVVGEMPDDPDKEPIIVFEITPLGVTVVDAKMKVIEREEALRGGDQ